MRKRLKNDHDNAQFLASALSKLNGITINLNLIKTNIVYLDFNHPDISLGDLMITMKSNGILFNSYNAKHSRLVTHRNISRSDVENVIDVFNKLLS